MRFVLALSIAALCAIGCDRRDRDRHRGYDRTTPSTERTTPPAIDQVRDPVSGEMVRKDSAIKYTHEGRDYYFASEENRRKFEENPSLYATPNDRSPK